MYHIKINGSSLPDTDNENSNESKPVAFPNPTTGKVYIENYTMGDEVTVYNTAGVVLQRTFEGIVDLFDYPVGIYLLKTKNKTMRVFKQ